jgi:hypothetical protein
MGKGSDRADGTLSRQMKGSPHGQDVTMCRNIRTLFNFEPPATEDEIRGAALQFVRKLSGFNSPSKANRAAFDRAVEDIAATSRVLIESLVTSAGPRDRQVEGERARQRAESRYRTLG